MASSIGPLTIKAKLQLRQLQLETDAYEAISDAFCIRVPDNMDDIS